MKLYTSTGDGGETSPFDGTRVSKADARVTAALRLVDIANDFGRIMNLK